MISDGIIRKIRQWLSPRAQQIASPSAAVESTPDQRNAPVSGIYIPSGKRELRQGEILSNLIEVRSDLSTLTSDEPLFEQIKHPLAIILSQDCDLLQDFVVRDTARTAGRDLSNYTSDKLIPSILFCELIEAEELLKGITGTKEKKHIRQNKDDRYQYLRAVEPSEDILGLGLPALGIDFKRYFTIPTGEVYARLEFGVFQRCRLASPYLEHLSVRFSNYLSRIALPEDHLQ